MAYATKTQIKQYLGINWTAGIDAFVDTLIAGATDYIERFCGDERYGRRAFEAPSPDDDVEKHFDGNGNQRLYIGDLREITSLVVDGTTLVQNTDFYLYPLNAEDEEKPYTSIELVQPESSFSNANPRSGNTIPYVFEELQRSVVVTGKWGFSETVPEDVAVATMKLVGGIIKENIGDADLREVTQEALGEYSTSYAKIKDIAHSLGVNALLTDYRRKRNGRSGRGVVQVS